MNKNPFAFERNEHGHVMLIIIGAGLTGAQEIARLEAGGYRVSGYAKQCFTSAAADGYDAKHHLVAERKYKIALLPHREIERNSDRTTEALRKRGIERYGYKKPLAGIVPRIRETVSDKQLEDLGLYYIVALHDPIKAADGVPRVLGADRFDVGRWLSTCWVGPAAQWNGIGASAFLVSAS